ncbi:MAG TPA: hypothetical protein PJ982_01025 [Lacipirellulaceae bacterium]|nr:hypothetical protein [Lacipirellulaceae bacterium]
MAPTAERQDPHTATSTEGSPKHSKPHRNVCPTETPADHDLLEALDDAMFAAIAGDSVQWRRAQQLWPEAVAQLPWEIVEESRQQYLRYAVEVSQQRCVDQPRDPAAAMLGIEVIELLVQQANEA